MSNEKVYKITTTNNTDTIGDVFKKYAKDGFRVAIDSEVQEPNIKNHYNRYGGNVWYTITVYEV